jgi:hypothetical protein
MSDSRVRQNYWAILVAGIASFVLEAVWYSVFLQQWLNGIGRTMESLRATGMNEYVQYAVALVMAALAATGLSCVTQLTGAQTAWRGMKVGALVWLAFICTTLMTEYIFEVRMQLFAINAGFWLLDCVVMGAIVGGWKKRGA